MSINNTEYRGPVIVMDGEDPIEPKWAANANAIVNANAYKNANVTMNANANSNANLNAI
jgi:hypothetical protein